MQRPTVLVIDDDESMRRLFHKVLTQGGFDVRTAEDGLDALQVIREHIPDVIVLDLNMPRMDGVEFHRHLVERPHTAHVPVVVVTGTTLPPPPGVVAALSKPFDVQELLATVSMAAAHPYR